MYKRKAIKGSTMALALSGLLAFSSTPTYAVLGDQVLKAGMDNTDVKILQEELRNFGLFQDDTTTYYGNKTEEAVRAFQISQGIEINGTFDIATFNSLKALKENTTTAKSTSEVVELTPEVKTPAASALTFNRSLDLKVTGEDVRLLQESLKAMGYLVIDECTDYFGVQTEQALKEFQISQGLSPDGVAGLRTIETINKVLTGRGIALPAVNRSSENSRTSTDIIATAKKYLGVRYSYGGSSPKGFDCSGFTSYVFKQHGITLPRSSGGQATVGTKVSRAELKSGDLLIFSNTYKSGVSHTGIYIGNGQFIHSSSTSSGGVIISDLDSTYYAKHFSYGRRLF